ncbi:MAG TPA: hypothetical protein ENN65_03050, partial [Candidatus Hydrogenedentes bacterium]|nr:hypothetical protein [Candidatus Hydrogenedentota bacterium]
MNTAEETQRSLVSPKADAAILVGGCAVAGAVIALMQYVYPPLAPMALALLAGGSVAAAVFGFSGLLALVPVLLAFLLMQRFDESLA